MTHDGLGKYLKEKITKAPGKTADIVQILKDTHTDVVVSYLPVGSEQATKWYVEQVLEAGCGFVNCIPVFIAREDYWNDRFKKAGPADRRRRHQVAGRRHHRPPRAGPAVPRPRREDDAHVAAQRRRQHGLLQHARARAAGVQEDLQDQRGHLDHGPQLPADDVYIGPSDYVPWLTDRKWAHIRLEGQAFGDVPLNVEMKLEVWDSPNSAGIVIDAVRCCKLALNHGVGGQLDGPSSYLMKSPHTQRPDDEAREETEKFIAKHRGEARHEAQAREGAEEGQGQELTALALRAVPNGPQRAGRSQFLHGASALSASPRGRALRIAQVTPYAWEAGHEVNAVRRAGRGRAGGAGATAWPSSRPLALGSWSARRARRRAARGATRLLPAPGGRAAAARRRRGAAASARRAGARARCRSTSRARSRSC